MWVLLRIHQGLLHSGSEVLVWQTIFTSFQREETGTHLYMQGGLWESLGWAQTESASKLHLSGSSFATQRCLNSPSFIPEGRTAGITFYEKKVYYKLRIFHFLRFLPEQKFHPLSLTLAEREPVN